jgi:shikimate kinase
VHVVIVGPMGVGKSTIGREVATRLGRPLRDSDDDLVAARGITGRALAAHHGVEALHRWEADHLLAALADETPAVIAAASSVVDDERVAPALGDAFVVWLRAPVAALVSRALASDHRRDLGDDPAATVTALAAERDPRYAAVADLAVDAVDGDPTRIGLAVLEALPVGPRPAGAAGTSGAPGSDRGPTHGGQP